MKSLEDRLNEAKEDPVKVRRAFTAIWVASYAMLMLGAFIIIAVLVYERLLRMKPGPTGPFLPFSFSCGLPILITDYRLYYRFYYRWIWIIGSLYKFVLNNYRF